MNGKGAFMQDKRTPYVKGAMFEKADLMLIDSATLLGFLINLKQFNNNILCSFRDVGKRYIEAEKEVKKKITYKQAKTEEEKKLKKEKRSRRERELLNLSGLLRLAEIFDYDNDLLLGYLLQFKKITPENKKICNEQGILFFEQHKMQKEYKKLEAERKKRKQEKEEEDQRKREQIRVAEYQTEEEEKIYKKNTVIR